MPKASAPWALPDAISNLLLEDPSSRSAATTCPPASRTTTVSGLKPFARAAASASPMIVRAVCRLMVKENSSSSGVAWRGTGSGGRARCVVVEDGLPGPRLLAAAGRRLGPLPALRQRPLGVAVRLLPSGEDQVQRGLEGRAALEVGTHRPVARLVGVLLVDQRRHPGEGLADLGLGDQPGVQPVRDLLAGDPQGRAVLHQADALEVGHGRAADAQPDPAHDVAQDGLRVGLQLVALLLLG